MIGIGAQDHFGRAKTFVNETGVSFTMLWSDSSAPWQHFSVVAHPRVVLLDKSGKRTGYGPRSFSASSVKSKLDELG